MRLPYAQVLALLLFVEGTLVRGHAAEIVPATDVGIDDECCGSEAEGDEEDDRAHEEAVAESCRGCN